MNRMFPKIPMMTAVIVTVAFAAALFSVPSCNKPTRSRNVILITLDTQRADHISCYDSAHSSTPNLDALAESGLLFENCYSLIPITLPAHAAIFYSRQPHELQVYNNGEILKEQSRSPSVVEIFRKWGYKTAAFVSMAVLKAAYGLDHGFEEYYGTFPHSGRFYYTAEEVTNSVFPWLEQNLDRDFFLWLHYSDPHAPYHPPHLQSRMTMSLNGDKLGDYAQDGTVYTVELDLQPGSNTLDLDVDSPLRTNPERRHAKIRQFELSQPEGPQNVNWKPGEGCLEGPERSLFSCAQKARIHLSNPGAATRVILTFQLIHALSPERRREMYREEVEYLDGQLGRLFAKITDLGLDAKTHILVVGDHGEGLGEYLREDDHPHFGHIRYLNDIYTRIPLIIRAAGPEARKGRIKALVSLLDVAPSLLSLANIRPVRQYQGVNLVAPKIPVRRDIIQATYRPEAEKSRFAILAYPLHLLFSPEDQTYELFDLESDPAEMTNIYSEKRGDESVRRLRLRLEAATRDIIMNRPAHKVDDNTKKMLRALGYIR